MKATKKHVRQISSNVRTKITRQCIADMQQTMKDKYEWTIKRHKQTTENPQTLSNLCNAM